MYIRISEDSGLQFISTRRGSDFGLGRTESGALGLASSGMDLPPLKVPTPGRFYKIQQGKGGLETTARRAYETKSDSERVKKAQEINNHPLNRKFWRIPKNAYEKKFYTDGIIEFSPNFTCEKDQRRTKRGEKRCFARIWIPPIETPIPKSPRPIRPIPPGPVPNIPPFRPSPPAPQPFLPKARFRSLSEARKAVRIALWINGEASGLLGGPSRTSEWVWEIFKVTIPGKPDRYGFTRLRTGSEQHASPDVRTDLRLRTKLGLSPTDNRIQLVEVGHTHPSGPRARSNPNLQPEKMSGILFSRNECKDGPIPCGDKAWVLATKVPFTLITPKGKIIVATSKLKEPLGEFSRKNKHLWKNDNVHVEPIEKGIDKRGEWCPPISDLKDRVEKRIKELAKERNLTQQKLNRVLDRLRRQRSECFR